MEEGEGGVTALEPATGKHHILNFRPRLPLAIWIRLQACIPPRSHSLPIPPLQDKILQSMSRGREVTVTNDGATILKSVHVDNPAARVLVGVFWRGVWG